MFEKVRTVQVKISDPHEAQQKLIDASRRFNVLQCGRRFGKTTLGLDRVIETAIEGKPAAWFAPTYKLLSDVWRSAKYILSAVQTQISEQERRIKLVTGGTLDFWSLDLPDAGRGRKYARVVIDEAGLVRDLQAAWQEAIRPTLTDLKGDAWFLGTPKGHNYFQRLYTLGQSGEADWISWRLPTIANPIIDQQEVESARADMLPSAFNQEYLGIPADDGGNPFGLEAIRNCAADALSAEIPIAFGIDLAKYEDWTVVCGLDKEGRVCRLERWQTDWGQSRRRILDLIGDTPTLCDSTGVGDPIVEDMARVSWTVDGYKFTSTSKQQLMEGLCAAIQRREIRFPQGWLINELESFEYEYRAGGVRYSAPEGFHDDGVCALALAVNKWRDVLHKADHEWGQSELRIMFDRRTAPRKSKDLMEQLKNRYKPREAPV